MTIQDNTALLLDQTADPTDPDNNKNRPIYRYRPSHVNTNSNINRQNSSNNNSSDTVSVIVAYQDVTSEYSSYTNSNANGLLSNGGAGHLLAAEDFDLVAAIRPEMEKSFYKDFMCCGHYLNDMHALIHHYEDCHVRFEGDTRDVVCPGEGLLMMAGSNGASTTHSPHGRRKRMLAVDTEQCDFLTDDPSIVSAFDNTVLRTINTSFTSTGHNNHKRSRSVPTRIPNIPTTADPSIDHYQFIQSILEATIDTPDSPGSAPTAPIPKPAAPNTSIYSKSAQLLRTQSSMNYNKQPSTTTIPSTATVPYPKFDRPYVCSIAGCAKSYKNPNGLKYHEKHGHDEAAENVERPYKCAVVGCGNKYKNPNGLKYHMAHAHPNQVKHLGGGGPYPASPSFFKPSKPVPSQPSSSSNSNHNMSNITSPATILSSLSAKASGSFVDLNRK